MLFNSIDFAIFLPIVFILYWFVAKKNLKLQNIILLTASYIFYGWWDWRFLSLIVFSSYVDYYVGIGLLKTKESKKRKALLWTSIIVNLGFLGFFKYYNFFVENFVDAFTFFGENIESSRLNIILPVGISFYTFQTLSYSIDVYRKKLEPTKDVIAFFAFVSFFPQLVAGPIERASNLLPQILRKRKFLYEQGIDGLRLILWGLFKKVVIADNLAPVVNDIFDNQMEFSGGTLILGVIFFSFQIYTDFSGYSDIAIGTSKLFGIELMSNFKFPYFSRNIGEFWRRWHISLSTWFRDYLYIPLGGSRTSKSITLRNIFIIFLVSGFWHGANWTFLTWGFIHALFFLPSFIFGTNRKYKYLGVGEGSFFKKPIEIVKIFITFIIVTFAWIFFRAENIIEAFLYIGNLRMNFPVYKSIIWYPIFLILLEWFMRENERKPLPYITNDYIAMGLLSITILLFRYVDQGNVEFIYFQF